MIKTAAPAPSPRITRPGLPSKIEFAVLNSEVYRVSVLSDLNAGAPTVTGGYAKWGVIDRPLRAGLTIFEGYDPSTIEIPILFDDFIGGNGDAIEDDIQKLEYMAGRGPGAANTLGDNKIPPIITVQCYDTDGNAFPLIPKPYQYSPSTNTNPPIWVITGLSWDANPERNHAGNRIRQAATVTVTQYVESIGLDSLQPEQPKGKTKWMLFPHNRTMRYVATQQQTTVVKLRTLNNFGNNKKLDGYLRDPNKKFKHQLSIKVPRVS